MDSTITLFQALSNDRDNFELLSLQVLSHVFGDFRLVRPRIICWMKMGLKVKPTGILNLDWAMGLGITDLVLHLL